MNLNQPVFSLKNVENRDDHLLFSESWRRDVKRAASQRRLATQPPSASSNRKD
jgi:hypothetical protein